MCVAPRAGKGDLKEHLRKLALTWLVMVHTAHETENTHTTILHSAIAHFIWRQMQIHQEWLQKWGST